MRVSAAALAGVAAVAAAASGCAGAVFDASLLSAAASACAVAAAACGTIAVRGDRARMAAFDAQRAELAGQLATDPLTGLLNRGAFDDALGAVAPEGGELGIVLFLDLDRFKEVNDTLGHRVGDALLRAVGGRLAGALPPGSIVARLGGDEFSAILPPCADTPPERYGDAVVAALCAPFTIEGQVVSVGTSVGIAVGDPAIVDGHELLRRADLAMYAAKAGRSRGVRLYDDALDRSEMRDSTVRIELGRALIDEQFALHYQPLVDARTGLFESAEALLRAQAPGLRDVPTASLIAVAEASGQIHALTDWTIRTALDAARRLRGGAIAVNISPVYFRQPDFAHDLLDRLLVARVRPDRLVIEMTEGVMIDNMEAARRSLSRLREVGVRVHLDDFGTGYSSLSYIQSLELDGMKLDKSFLRGIGDRRRTSQIIRSMIDFGHSLDLKVVVEGVEADWQARLLQLLGADLLQGYHLSMPVPLDGLLAFQARHALEPVAFGPVDAVAPAWMRAG